MIFGKSTILILLSLLTVSCAISPKSDKMKRYVYTIEHGDNKGVVTHMDLEHSRFTLQPSEIAENLMKENCGGEYKIVKTVNEQRTFHDSLGKGSYLKMWKNLHYSCE